jgi:hypothetical protein
VWVPPVLLGAHTAVAVAQGSRGDAKMMPKLIVNNLRLKFGNEKGEGDAAKEGHHVTTRGVPSSPCLH